jgi:PTS system nitrogen regulatory IIA component
VDSDPDSPFLNMRELAAYLEVHRNTIYRLIQRGELPMRKIGGDWRMHKADLLRWLYEQHLKVIRSGE